MQAAKESNLIDSIYRGVTLVKNGICYFLVIEKSPTDFMCQVIQQNTRKSPAIVELKWMVRTFTVLIDIRVLYRYS